MRKENVAKMLSYAGILPFLAAATLHSFFTDFGGLEYDSILLAYSAVIVSFLSGVHWGVYLFKNVAFNLFVQSNFIALLAWLAILLNNIFSVAIVIFCFVYLLLIDFQLKRIHVLETWFFDVRYKVSCIVITILTVHLVFY